MPFRPELEHRGEPATPPVPEITQPVAYHLDDPSRGNFAARLRAVEDHSFGTLPTRLALELAQSSLADHQINRASRLLAREFDLSPWQMFASYGAPAAQQFVDPVTGGPMSFATARRFLRPHEIGIARTLIRNAMRAGVPTADYTGQLPLDPSRLRQTFAAMAPVSGEQTPFMSAFGAAVEIARDPNVDLGLFSRNLEVTSRFAALTPELQIAAAHQAAVRDRTIQSPADIATALLPNLAPQIEAGQEAAAYQRPSDLSVRVTPKPPLTGEARMSAELGQAVVAGISGPGDWLKVLQDAQDDYVAAGKELEQGVHLPFPHSWAGIALGWTLDKLNRSVGAVTRIVVAVPEAFHQETPEVAGVQAGGRYEITDATLDAWNIMWGRTTDAKELEKKGYPGWATALSELALGFYIDPVQIGFNSWSGYKAVRLAGEVRTGVSVQKIAETVRTTRLTGQIGRGRVSGLDMLAGDWRQQKAGLLVIGEAADARAADHLARSQSWLYGKVRRLNDASIPSYLRTEADRVKNPELFFERAVGKFRKTFETGGGIDHFTAAQIWRWNKNAKKLGLSELRREDGIRSILGAAIGLPVETGTLAHEVEVLSQIRRAEATTSMAEAVGLRPTVRAGEEITALGEVPDEAKQALGALDDLAADIASGTARRMFEIPHMNLPGGPQWIDNYLRTSRLAGTEPGRIVRSLLQTNPIRAGEFISLGLEESDVVRDLERTLIRAKKWSPQEIAKAKLRVAAAISKDNPTRSEDFASIVSGYAAETFRRKNASWGAGKELSDLVKANLTERFGEAPVPDVFASFAATDAARIRQRELQTMLAGELAPDARAAARKELDDLAAQGRTMLPATARPGSGLEPAPYLRSLQNNTVRFLDPVLYDAGMSEVMGSIRKWNRAIRSHFGEIKTTNRAVRVPIRQWTDRVAEDFIFTPFLSVWKPLAVIRPAYILRLVGIEEMARFLATGGLMRRLESGVHSGPLLQRLGFAEDRFIPLGYKLAEEVGQRANTVEDALMFMSDRHFPGELDFKGWSRADQDEGQALADIVRSGGALDDANRAAAMRLVRTYKTQLESAAGIYIDKLHLRGDAFRAAEVARANQQAIDDGLLRLRVPGHLPPEEMVNNVGNVRLFTATDRHMRDELRRLDASAWEGKVRSDPGFVEDLHHALARTFGSDALGNRYLRDFAENKSVDEVVDDAMRWLTTKPEGQSYAEGLMHGGEDVTRADIEFQVRIGANYVADLTAGRPEIAAAAASGHLSVDMLKIIDPRDLPLYVHGAVTHELMTATIGPVKRGRNFFARWILQEPTNRLTRQPYFKHWYDHMNEALIREAQVSGTKVTEEMLAGFHQTARQFAISQVKRVMFDFTRTGRFEEMNRFSLVFVQPYLEEPLAWGRILRQNPAMAWHVERIGRAGIDSGFVQKDPKTGELVIPASWWAGAAPILAMATGAHLGAGKLAGGGWQLSIPLQAFNLFASGTLGVNLGAPGGEFPVPLPNFNPIAQMAMQRLMNVAQDHDIAPGVVARLTAWLYQYGEVGPNNPMGLAPAWVRHALEGVMPGWNQKNADFLTTHFLQVQEAMGLTPDEGMAKTQAQHYSLVRMLFSWVFPGAPRVAFPTAELENEHTALVDPVNGLGWVEGNKRWMELHPDLRLFTVARTVWNGDDPEDPQRSPVPIPPTRLVAQLLQTKGAREFAKAHPAWVWAIIPDELANGEFDPGSWFGQIAQSDRVPLSGGAFLAAGAAQDGWDAFFALKEGWIAEQERLDSQGIGEGDPPYEHAKDLYDAAVDHLRQENPSWKTAYDTHTTSGLDPKVLAEAYSLSRNKTFQKTDVGQALGEYLPLYESIKQDLHDENLSTLESVTADRLGITKRYEDGVAAIIEAHPQFATAYNLFFDQALRVGVKTAGDTARDRIDPATWDTVQTPWWSQYETLRDGPNVAPTLEARNAAYGSLRDYVNLSYSKFKPSEHPLAIWWKATRPDQREAFMVSLMGRSYQFYSRFDKQVVIGERSNKATENLWSTYETFRSGISTAGAIDPKFDVGAAYDRLDGWVALNAAQNPVFAAQVEHANTWGYTFERIRSQLFPGEDATPQWDAFLDGVRQFQQVATLAQLHGPDDSDPRKAIVYRSLQARMLTYVDYLKSSPGGTAFAAQWDWLEKESGPDPALSYFVPDIYYPLGVATA